MMLLGKGTRLGTLGATPRITPGYAINGSCDPATGNGTGNDTGYYMVTGPTGQVSCLSSSDPILNYGVNPVEVPTPPIGPTTGQPVPLGTTPITTVPASIPTMPSPTPIDCAAQQAQLNAFKAEVTAKGGTWNFPPGQGPFGPIPPCVSTTANPSASNADFMLGTFDVTQFVSNYGVWLGVGVGALILLTLMKK